MSNELKELMEKQGKAFADFRQANDERLAKLEKGSKDPLLEEKVEKANSAITEISEQMKELSKKAGRPAPTAADEKAEVQAKYSKAYGSYLRKGRDDGLGELQVKAVEVAVDASGGYAVPAVLDAAITEIERDNAPMRELVSAITVSTTQYEKLTNLGGASSGWVDENDARTETNAPTLASVSPAFGEVYANVGAYQQALDDIFFDVEKWLADEVGRQFALDENDAFTSGNGTKKPKGILGYTLSTSVDGTRTFGQIQKLVSASAGAFAPDTIIDLIHSLQRGYRKNAKFVTSNLGVAALRKLKDSDDNYLWSPGLTAGAPSSLLGYEVHENDDMPVPAVDANALLFGDFKRAYLICDVKGIRVLRDPYTAKPKVLFYSTKRVGGGVVDDRAVKVYTLSA